MGDFNMDSPQENANIDSNYEDIWTVLKFINIKITLLFLIKYF